MMVMITMILMMIVMVLLIVGELFHVTCLYLIVSRLVFVCF